MVDTNLVILTGRLTTDPEIKQTSGNKDVANFSIACNRGYYDKSQNWVDNTVYANCVSWNGTTKFLEKIKKGDKVLVTGEFFTEKYKDVVYPKFRVNKVSFLSSPKESSDSDSSDTDPVI